MSFRKTTISLALVGAVGLCSATLVALAAPKPILTKKPTPRFKPLLSTKQIMEGQKMMMSQIKEGILDGEWENAKTAALILGELSNVNTLQSTEKEYKGFAKSMAKDSVGLAKLLAKKDADGAKKMLKQTGKHCSDCHDKFKD